MTEKKTNINKEKNENDKKEKNDLNALHDFSARLLQLEKKVNTIEQRLQGVFEDLYARLNRMDSFSLEHDKVLQRLSMAIDNLTRRVIDGNKH